MANHFISLEPGSLKDLSSLNYFTLSHNRLKDLPDDIFQNLSSLKYLDLSENTYNTMVLPRRICNGLPMLLELDLHAVFFHLLTEEHLQGCPNLRSLKVSISCMQLLPVKAIQAMTMLTVLDASGTQLSSLPAEAFHTLSHLEYLNLSITDVQGFEEKTFFNLSSLSTLDLAFTHLNTLPKLLFHGLSSLEILVISHTHLIELSAEAFHGLFSLRELYLDCNSLISLPGRLFKDLHSLQFLSLNDNQLEILDSQLFSNMYSISKLLLMNNHLNELPFNPFEGLHILSYIDLHGNQLRAIHPSFFSDHPRLETVLLYENDITEISKDIFRNGGIRWLRFALNKLTALPEDLFQGLPLETIDLSSNHISKLSEKVFCDISSISYLSLQGNNLVSLTSVFKGLTNLEVLDLQDNRLEHFSDDLFQDLYSLKMLHLSNNRLNRLSHSLFRNLENLTYLGLTANRLPYLEASIFQSLTQLTRLSLRSNQFEMFDFCSFNEKLKIVDLSLNRLTVIACLNYQASLPSFTRVILAGNFLNTFPRFLINMIEDGSYIDLSNNRLALLPAFIDIDWKRTTSKFPYKNLLLLNNNPIEQLMLSMSPAPTPFDQVISLFKQLRIDMSGNPMMCNCHARQLYQIMQRVNDTHYDELDYKYLQTWRCVGPLDVEGKPLIEVRYEDLRCNLNVPLCPDNCECWTTPELPTLVNCKKKGLTEPPSVLPSDTDVLHLEVNEIESIENLGAYKHISKLSRLYLHQNSIREIPVFLVPALIKLDELSLSDNLLTAIPYDFSNMNHTKLSLGGNVLKCDCHAKWLHSWILSYKHHIRDVDIIFCDSGEQVMVKHPDDFICRLSRQEIGLIAMSAIFSVLAVATVFVYRNRTEIKVVLYTRFNWHPFDKPEENDVLDKLYDAFVSYSGHDVQWVLNTLQPRLENPEMSYRLCLNDRDFMPGEEITTNILNGVKFSRKMIMILTRSFLESEWCRFEFITAHRRVLKGRTNYLIVILFDNINVKELDEDLQAYLKTNTYLYYADKWFWDKLMYAMPEKSLVKLRGHHFPEGGFKTLCPTPISLAAILNQRQREIEAQLIREIEGREIE